MSMLAAQAPPGPAPSARRTPGKAAKLVVLALALVAVAAAAATIAAPSGIRAVVAGRLSLVGPTPAHERISLTLILRLPGARRLRGALAALENPRSSRFRQLIDARSFGMRFGISSTALAELERRLERRGLHVTASYPQRTALALSGTVAAVGRLLHVSLASYVDAAGHRSHAPTGSPSVPSSLGSLVAGVTGLDTRPRWHAHDVPLGGLTPQSLPSAYDITALRSLGISGRGLTIAIVSFSDYDHSDPATFASRFGINGPAPRVIPVDGGTTDTSGAGEANLDIDVVRAVAPDAQILVYEVPQSSSSYADVINRIVADHRADIISSSWGECELFLNPVERAADSQALSAADAAGISMFVASGDSGAYDCQQGNLPDHRLSVDWPASSAGAIAVGGTRLSLAVDGSYQSEGAWEGVLSGSGGGGGFTTGDPRPSWQSGAGVRAFTNGKRGVPDVSADADPGTGWLTYSNGSYGEAGGTSAAAPFWAASMGLVAQYAASRGVGRLGFVDPILYALASSRQRFAPFHDVTLGGNRYYQTAAGWDPATGLGSPDVYNLARDVVAYLRAHPGR